MSGGKSTSWFEQAATAMRADPAKSGILSVLGLVLLVLCARLVLSGNSAPATAVGAVAENGAGPVTVETPVPGPRTRTGDAMTEWLRGPSGSLKRNLFAVKFDFFPQDGKAEPKTATVASGFWDDLAKSDGASTDQKIQRQALLENLRQEASRLRLESILMGSQPKALFDGGLVGEGDVVASFRVLKIEARRVIIEREGIKLEVMMK